MPDPDPVHSARLGVAERAARAGGEAALRYYGTAVAWEKENRSPVTAADMAANRAIAAILRAEFPDDAVLSEESADSAERLSRRVVWIVDPLDGTKEFLARNGEFSIMIGVAEAGTPVLGVVYLPVDDILYSAIRSGGAWVERNGGRARLSCAEADLSSLRMVGSRSHPDPFIDEIRTALGITDVEPCGSVGVKCGRIAEGRRDLYIHPVPYLQEWDTCAPEILLREAGGTVSDCLGDPLRYNKVDPRQPHGILARGAGPLDHVVAAVRQRYRSDG